MIDYPDRWGVLTTPQCGGNLSESLDVCSAWAMDNDRFNADISTPKAYMFWQVRFLAWLDKCQAWRDKCLFVVAPDVVCDARATLREFPYWHTIIRKRGYPIAFALQNGVEDIDVPWSWIDFVFVGGDDEFKEGPVAARLAQEAKSRGIGVHIGRVNSRRRALMAAKIGADTIDGTSEARAPDTNAPKWNRLLAEMETISSGQQTRMFE
jgi:hypothetical protein